MNKKEMEQLKPGDVIQHKTNPQWAFIVHQNFGDRLTAVRTIELRSCDDWDVIKPIQIEDQPKINIEKASELLYDVLRYESWFHTVGIGNNLLVIYTKVKKYPKTFVIFKDYPVEYHYFGKIAPLGKL